MIVQNNKNGPYAIPAFGQNSKLPIIDGSTLFTIKGVASNIKKNKVNVAISAHGNSIRMFRKIMEKASRKETIHWFIPYEKFFEYSVKI